MLNSNYHVSRFAHDHPTSSPLARTPDPHALRRIGEALLARIVDSVVPEYGQ